MDSSPMFFVCYTILCFYAKCQHPSLFRKLFLSWLFVMQMTTCIVTFSFSYKITHLINDKVRNSHLLPCRPRLLPLAPQYLHNPVPLPPLLQSRFPSGFWIPRAPYFPEYPVLLRLQCHHFLRFRHCFLRFRRSSLLLRLVLLLHLVVLWLEKVQIIMVNHIIICFACTFYCLYFVWLSYG